MSLVAPFLAQLRRIGGNPRDGWSRLAFGPDEREAHRLFRTWAEGLGMRVWTDAIGNTFAELAGRHCGPAVMAGSHLDTVPAGGAFDGAAGVAAAIEAARQVAGSGGLDLPLRLVVFSAEEGARFGAPCIGSRTASGAFDAPALRGLYDASGGSAAERACEVGLRPDDAEEARWKPDEVAAFLELHIEQGRVLESRGLHLGIVSAIAGTCRLTVRFVGRADHSGATPMGVLRRDALGGASELVLAVERSAQQTRTTVATIGNLEVTPGSATTIPGTAQLTLDVRDVDADRQRELAEKLLDMTARIAARRGLEVSANLLSNSSPVILHKSVRDCLAQAATSEGINFCIMRSGAGHDAAHIAPLAPTGMLFVPCRDGRSHTPEEWSSTEDISRGAEVMATALRDLARRAAALHSHDMRHQEGDR